MSQPRSPHRISSRTWMVVAGVVMFFLLSSMARQWLASVERVGGRDAVVDKSVPTSKPQRIIALAPSTVEVLYALGLGDRVVGISRFSSYPEEALALPQVAGFVDVDFELLLELKPDCVVMVDSQRSLLKKLHELGIRTLSVDHASVAGILDSFSEISDVCGHRDEADTIVKEMRSHLKRIQHRGANRQRPRVLISIERDTDAPEPDQVIAAGNAGFHQELIQLAGGENAYHGPIAFPTLSREKLINLNPDIIIDLTRDKVAKEKSKAVLVAQWSAFSELKAVKEHRVKIVVGNQHLIPGPRFLDTLDVFVHVMWGEEDGGGDSSSVGRGLDVDKQKGKGGGK